MLLDPERVRHVARRQQAERSTVSQRRLVQPRVAVRILSYQCVAPLLPRNRTGRLQLERRVPQRLHRRAR